MAEEILFGPSKNAKPVKKGQKFPPKLPEGEDPFLLGKSGINALQFIKKVAKTQLINSAYVSIKNVQKSKIKSLYKFETITRVPGERPRVHTQRIYSANPYYKGPLYLCPALKIACTCGNHLFEWEVSNYNYNASDIIYSNGDYPVHTNPSLRLGCCKHILKCLMFLVVNKL